MMRALGKTTLVKALQVSAARTIVFALMLTIALPANLLARTFQEGYGKYMRADFHGAEAAFRLASKSSKAPAERAKILKFLGISQYMQKKTALAQVSFRAALSLVPTLTISSSEVLDEAVITFFNNVKGAAKPNAARALPTTAAAPKAGVQVPTGARRPAKRTSLRIQSNAANASILIDGILAGQTGSLIEVDPGVIEVQLSAPGYLSKRARIRIHANQENAVTLNLEKPKPKPKPAPKPAAKVASGGSRPQSGKDNFLPDPGVDRLFDDADSGADLGSGRNLQQEFALDAGTGGYTAQQPQQAYPQQPMYQQPPMYQQQPMYPQQPMYAPPMYAYPTQPYAPGYAPMPYAQPYGMYQQPSPYAPAPPPMAAPTPIPVPSQDPAVVAMPPYDDSANETFLPPAKSKSKKRQARLPSYSAPGKKKSSRKSSSSSSTTRTLVALLPFGAGQFQNGNMLLGSIFAASEVGVLYWWYKNKTEADQAAAGAEEYFAREDVRDEDKEAYEEDIRPYIEEKRQQQNYSLYAFIGLWAIGAGEAIINEPAPKKKSTKKRRLSVIESDANITKYALLTEDEVADEMLAETNVTKTNAYLPQVSLGIMMKEAPDARARETGVGLMAEWNF